MHKGSLSSCDFLGFSIKTIGKGWMESPVNVHKNDEIHSAMGTSFQHLVHQLMSILGIIVSNYSPQLQLRLQYCGCGALNNRITMTITTIWVCFPAIFCIATQLQLQFKTMFRIIRFSILAVKYSTAFKVRNTNQLCFYIIIILVGFYGQPVMYICLDPPVIS